MDPRPISSISIRGDAPRTECYDRNGNWHHVEYNGLQVFNVAVDLLGLVVLTFLFSRRVARVQNWLWLTPGRWLSLSIYISAFLMLFFSAFVKYAFGLDRNPSSCTTTSIVCIFAYFLTKLNIYFYLAEKAYLVHASGKPRFKDGLWLFNTFAMLIPFAVALVMCFLYRKTPLRANGECVLWLQQPADITVMVVDFSVVIYLTVLFLIPVLQTVTATSKRGRQVVRLRGTAKKALIGCIGTMLPTIANMSLALYSQGEWGWVCLISCTIDILICIVVLHLITAQIHQEDDQLSALASKRNCSYCGGNEQKKQGPDTVARMLGLSFRLNTTTPPTPTDIPLSSNLLSVPQHALVHHPTLSPQDSKTRPKYAM